MVVVAGVERYYRKRYNRTDSWMSIAEEKIVSSLDGPLHLVVNQSVINYR